MGDSRYRIGLFVFFGAKSKFCRTKEFDCLEDGSAQSEDEANLYLRAIGYRPVVSARGVRTRLAIYERIEHSFISTRSLAVADPEDRAAGGEEGLGAMPPTGVQGAEPTLGVKLEY